MGKKKRLNRIITRWIRSDLPDVDGGVVDGSAATVLLLGVTRIPTSPTPERRQLVLPPQHQQVCTRRSPPACPRHPTNNHQRPQHCNGHGYHQIGPPIIPARSPWKLGYKRLDDAAIQSCDDATVTSTRPYCRLTCSSPAAPRDIGAAESALSGREDNIMDRSVDSIGTCSLDVDASSTGNLSVAADLSEKSSVDTLRSVSLLTAPSTHQQNPASSSAGSYAQISVPCTDAPRSRTNGDNNIRLPSYLSLACTVNGYSTTTNYDPERLLSRSRDPSPHRLTDTGPTYSTLNNLLSPPNLVPLPNTRTMNNVTNIYKTTKTSTAYLSKDTNNSFVKNMLENENRMNTVESNGIMRSSQLYERETVDGCISSNGYHHSKQLIEECGESKSFIQQRVERLYGPGALAQGFFVMKRRQNRSFNDCHNKSTLNTSTNDTHSKSFNTTPTIQDTNYSDADSDIIRPMKQSTSSPALPVLRHLRPEFRAQLPALSPRKIVAANTVVVLDCSSNELTHIQKSNTVPVLKDTIVEDGGVATSGDDRIEGDSSNVIATKLNGLDTSNSADVTNIVNGSITDACPSNTNTNSGSTIGTAVSVIKDGHYFIQVIEREADRLLALAEQAEELLDTEADLSEDITGLIRSTSGKARLLASQKLQQFKGLCTNNMTQNVGQAFPTTNEDLQGFWDMVMLQVNQVDCLFQNLNKLKANKWVEEKIVVPKPLAGVGARKVVNRRPISSTPNNAVAEEARKQRELQRKRMMEERRKAIREQRQQNVGHQERVEIFVPENS